MQAQLGNNGTNPLQTAVGGPAVQPSNTFQLGEFLTGMGQTETNATGSVNRVLSVQAGLGRHPHERPLQLEPVLHPCARTAWRSTWSTTRTCSTCMRREDAVLTPSGTVACYAATQAATAAQYANCVPINPFGPTAVSWDAFNYIFQTTDFHQTNILDDLGGSIAGKVLDGWAGPITAALSAEMRFNAYDVTSNVPSSTFVDCTGLRLCNPLLPSYSQAVLQPVHASQNVWEVALEAEVPVLKDMPLIQAFDLNLAGRYTDYSVSGSVQTWKIGFNWNVVDSLRFRGTTSIDIRAPTLDDLFRPATILQNVFTDLHIPDPAKSQVQPNLCRHDRLQQPGQSQAGAGSVAHLYGGRGVDTGLHSGPDHVAGLLPPPSGQRDRVHRAQHHHPDASAKHSGGASIYCANYQRPLPFSDHTLANFATRLFTFNLNTASTQTEGWDFETNYGWQMSDLVEGWKGSWNGAPAGDLSAGHQQIGAFPGRAFHARRPIPAPASPLS